MPPSAIASLTAGLIERSRPEGVIDLGHARAFGVGHKPALSQAARRAMPTSAERPVGPVNAPPRRYGLTVRVEPELHDNLGQERLRTGQTTQAILHAALRAHLRDR